jgi:hypothetical protein
VNWTHTVELKMKTRFFSCLAFVALCVFWLPTSVKAQEAEHDIAFEWIEVQLKGIRTDFARPPIHARNLYHVSLAMYDAWAAYDDVAETMLLGKTLGGYTSEFDGIPESILPFLTFPDAQEEAISYAAYRVLTHRYENSPGVVTAQARFDSLFAAKGYDPGLTSSNYSGGSPAALGNYIAEQVIAFGIQDGANEAFDYVNLYYEPLNEQMVMSDPGNPTIADPNRWQPLAIDGFVDQSGQVLDSSPPFQSPEWGWVVPFALTDDQLVIYERDNELWPTYLDPGPPVYIGGDQPAAADSMFRHHFAMVSIWQSHHDPYNGVMIDASPASIGNAPDFPETLEEYGDFYTYFDGGDAGVGHDINPITGLPYEEQSVPLGDYTRILAEFWADGPDSETPPGHWFSILNEVMTHPAFTYDWLGEGDEITPLQYEVQAYLTLGGAVHDAAIAAWGLKGYYDYVRPVSAIRYMADQGQSSDPALPSYSPSGIPLFPGLIELVDDTDSLAGAEGEHIGKIKVYTWRGPDYIVTYELENGLDAPVDSAGNISGVGWILAENWWPYQRPSFVTPPFAGYVSGHSTFSRAAAEVLTAITGDPYFPGGMGEFECPQDDFLVFEIGPSVDVTLQWATYYDASDQCSLSRIWGGIHPVTDDIRGRQMGIVVGTQSVTLAQSYFDGSINSTCGVGPYGGCLGDLDGDGIQSVEDVLYMLANFGHVGPHPADIDLDDLVGTTDLLILLGIYGCQCP